MDEGQLQDNLGHTVSFRNTVLIMTSNAGARVINNDDHLGFHVEEGIMKHDEIKTSGDELTLNVVPRDRVWVTQSNNKELKASLALTSDHNKKPNN